MTTNFKTNGVDIDTLLIKPSESLSIPKEYRNYESGYWGTTGEGYSWGNSGNNLLANGGVATHRSLPTQISSGSEWAEIKAGSATAIGIKKDGTLWEWGASLMTSGGGLSTIVQVGTDSDWKTCAAISNSFGDSFLFVKNNGTLWSVGQNYYGQLGLNDYTHRSSPVQVGASTDWDKVYGGIITSASAFAIKKNGSLWAWGDTSYGSLGVGSPSGKFPSPIQVGSLTDWKHITTNAASTLAIKTDGTLWAWGNNSNSRLGLGANDYSHRSSPVQIGSMTNWKQVETSTYGTLAVKTDGTLWGCGRNDYYALGAGTVNNIATLSQLNLETNWSSISLGDYHSLAIKTDGTLWAAGFNSSGQLGDGTTGINSTFKKAQTQLNTWTYVYCVSMNSSANSFGIAYS